MSLSAPERLACEELARAPGTEFEGVQRFIPAAHEPRLLAFEALFRSLRDIPLSVSEPAVGLAKLGWWQKELAQASTKGSQHPVVRAMLVSGALAQLDLDLFNSYLHALMLQMQEECPADTAALGQSLRDTAGMEAQMLAGASAPDPLISMACAARLLELMRTLSRPDAEHGWLPLDLVARHKLARGADGSGAPREALVRDLVALTESWRVTAPPGPDDCKGAGAAYLVLRDSLVGKRLVRANRDPAGFLAGGQRPGFGEVMAVWNTARRLVRSDSWE